MAQATVRISIWTGSSAGSGASAESGMVMGKSDALDSNAAPVTIPSSTGTNFSWYKNLGLECTANAGNDIDNRRVHYVETGGGGTADLPTGMTYHYNAQASYVQSTTPAADSGSDSATPAGYTDMTGSAVAYDNSNPVTTVADGSVNGDYLRFCIGIDSSYASGPGAGVQGPDLRITYDES